MFNKKNKSIEVKYNYSNNNAYSVGYYENKLCIVIETHYDYAEDDPCGLKGDVLKADILFHDNSTNYCADFSKINFINIHESNIKDFVLFIEMKNKLDIFLKKKEISNLKKDIEEKNEVLKTFESELEKLEQRTTADMRLANARSN